MATVNGTAENETLEGTADNDEIFGFSGDDIILTSAGQDLIHGGLGVDTVDYSSAPNPIVVELKAQRGQDGTGSVDLITNVENVIGSSGNDEIVGDDNDNVLMGGAGADSLFGRDGDDTLNGGDGADRLNGGAGSDTYIIDLSQDSFNIITDPSGSETIRFEGSVNASINARQEGLNLVFSSEEAGGAAGGLVLITDYFVDPSRYSFEDADGTFDPVIDDGSQSPGGALVEGDIDAGNTFSTATAVSGDFTVDGQAGADGDNQDFFSFNVATSTEITANLTGLTAPTSLQLFNSDGIRIAESRLDGNADESITFQLDPGKYFIGVISDKGFDTSYNLNVALDAAGLIGDPGNTFANATATNLDFEASGTVGFGGDKDDLFALTPDADGMLQVDLTGLSANVDLHLYNSEGVRVADSRLDGTADESLSFDLDGGENYFLGVTPNSSAGSAYDVTASYTVTGSASAQAPQVVDDSQMSS